MGVYRTQEVVGRTHRRYNFNYVEPGQVHDAFLSLLSPTFARDPCSAMCLGRAETNSRNSDEMTHADDPKGYRQHLEVVPSSAS
jgi:hypothetical protein